LFRKDIKKLLGVYQLVGDETIDDVVNIISAYVQLKIREMRPFL